MWLPPSAANRISRKFRSASPLSRVRNCRNSASPRAVQYLSLSPNVSFTEDGQTGSRGISISMRGISNINTDESAFIQSIGIYLDEFSVASTANSTINLQLQDLERVEILRGPQGTYFGRNAVGGALNLTTKKPHDELEGEIIFGAQDYETRGSQWGVTGIMNLPVTENFWLRGVGYIEDNSGIVKNIVPDGGDSGHEYYMGRVSARWIVSDKTTVDLMGMYSNEDQGVDENVPSGVWDTDTVATFFLNDPAGTAFPAPLDDGTGFWPNNRSEIAHTAIGEKNENRAALGVLKIEHQWREDIVIKSITGYIHTEREKIFDNDLTPEDLVNRYEGREGDSWSTELRFEMTREKFDWTFGFLYAEDDVKDDPDADQPGGGLGVVTGVTTAVDGGVSLTPVPCGPQPCTPNTTIPIVGPGIVDFALTGSLPPLFDLSGGAAPGGVFPVAGRRRYRHTRWAAAIVSRLQHQEKQSGCLCDLFRLDLARHGSAGPDLRLSLHARRRIREVHRVRTQPLPEDR